MPESTTTSAGTTAVVTWRWRLGVALLAATGCCHGASAAPPPVRHDDEAIAGMATDCDRRPSAWAERVVGLDGVRYSQAVEQDVSRAASGIVATRNALSALLAVPPGATPPARLWLTTASDRIGSGVALTRSDDNEVAVFVFSPSCDPDPRPRQFEKTLLQELSGPYLRAATKMSPGGWTFFQAPNWFVQGMEEWVTLLIHTRPTDVVAAANVAGRAPPDGSILVRDGHIVVADPYSDGLALVAWMAASHGDSSPFQILKSDAPTFASAISEVLKLDEVGIAASYQSWRAGGR